MTTETTRTPGDTSGTRAVAGRPALGPLAVTAGLTSLVGVVLAALGGLLSGSAAALGAGVGAALAVVVLGGGSAVLDLVAGVLPVASLMVALLTYTLQLLVLALVLLALERSALLGGDLDRTWLGGAVVVSTMVWLVVAVGAFVRRRVPVFDLPEGGRS